MSALDDRPRPGREATITAEAKAWIVDLACRKAKDLGYPHELWTTRLLARHVREHGPAEGHACLAKLAQGTLCNILNEQEIKPHKVRYYLERRDPEFKQRMAEVLCVYREVKLIKETAAAAKQKPSDAVAIVSYDEKPGIQAIATTAPDLPPEPGRLADKHPRVRLNPPCPLAAASKPGQDFQSHCHSRPSLHNRRPRATSIASPRAPVVILIGGTLDKRTSASSRARNREQGPAPKGQSTVVGIRFQPADLAQIDAWVKTQRFWMSRPEAIRTLVRQALVGFKP